MKNIFKEIRIIEKDGMERVSFPTKDSNKIIEIPTGLLDYDVEFVYPPRNLTSSIKCLLGNRTNVGRSKAGDNAIVYTPTNVKEYINALEQVNVNFELEDYKIVEYLRSNYRHKKEVGYIPIYVPKLISFGDLTKKMVDKYTVRTDTAIEFTNLSFFIHDYKIEESEVTDGFMK